jgi:hypothetical protein
MCYPSALRNRVDMLADLLSEPATHQLLVGKEGGGGRTSSRN